MVEGVLVSPELDPVPVSILDPIADLVEIENGVLRVDPYRRPKPPDGSATWAIHLEALRRRQSTGFGGLARIPEDDLRRAEVLAVLLETKSIPGGFGISNRPSDRAQTMGGELNLYKLATLRMGPYQRILDVEYSVLSGEVTDRRRFADLRLAVYNAERAFRVMESYAWPGDGGIFNSAWRDLHFGKLRELVHGPTLLTQDEIRTFVTLSALSRWNDLVDGVNARVEKKLRRAQRTATLQMIAFTGLGLGFGAALGAGGGALLKQVLGRATSAQQAQLAGDLEDLAGSFKGDHPEFAAEIGRVVRVLELQAAAAAAPAASAPAAAATLQATESGSVSPGSVTSPPAAVASSRAAAPGNFFATLLDAIAGAIRRLLGR